MSSTVVSGTAPYRVPIADQSREYVPEHHIEPSADAAAGVASAFEDAVDVDLG